MLHFSFFLALLHTGVKLDLTDLGRDWIDFLGIFCIIGAVSFRVFVIGRVAGWNHNGLDSGPRFTVFRRAAGNAAIVGIAGVALVALAFIENLVESASEGASDAATQGWTAAPLGVALLLAVVGFVIARATVHRNGIVGWCIAGAVALYFTVSGIIAELIKGHWFGIVNPLHIIGGSMWIGTLFVLIAAGLPAVLNRETAHADHGSLVADFVGAFSPVALWSAALLGVTGVATAWSHLKYLSALWTTFYGQTLMVKLCLVAIVGGLGVWNWRRMRPMLGNEPATHTIRRSASTELAFAFVVLIVTAVLVNLPTPEVPIP